MHTKELELVLLCHLRQKPAVLLSKFKLEMVLKIKRSKDLKKHRLHLI
jgi:hypothetical protein